MATAANVSFGAWTNNYFTSADMRLQGSQLAKDLGMDYLQFFVNESSKAKEGNFVMAYSTADIKAMAVEAQPLLVGVTAFIVPNRAFIEAACNTLVPLCNEIGAASLIWDAEGLWAADGDMSHGDAANLIKELTVDLKCHMGMTSYPDIAVKPTQALTNVCTIGMPQAYTFVGRNSVPLGTGQTHAWGLWKTLYVGDRTDFMLAMGLASYDQQGVSSSILEGMQQAVDASTAAGATNICYWQLKYFDPAGGFKQVYDAMRIITGKA